LEYVPGILHRDTVYAVEAAQCAPASLGTEEKMLRTDLIVIDADTKRWRRNIQLLHKKLCVTRHEFNESSHISLRRVLVMPSGGANPPQITTLTDEVLSKRREEDEAEAQFIEDYGKPGRSVMLPDKQPTADEATFITLSLSNIVGVAIQLIRSL
jgi:hypothetical protein